MYKYYGSFSLLLSDTITKAILLMIYLLFSDTFIVSNVYYKYIRTCVFYFLYCAQIFYASNQMTLYAEVLLLRMKEHNRVPWQKVLEFVSTSIVWKEQKNLIFVALLKQFLALWILSTYAQSMEMRFASYFFGNIKTSENRIVNLS